MLDAELRPVREAIPRGSSILDVGAGSGNRAVQLVLAGYRVTAVEPDPVEAARARRQLGRRARVAETAVEELPTGEAGYDGAVLSHVLEHLADPDAALRDLRGRLRPGGAVVVLAPNAAGLEARAFGGRWHGWEPSRHVWHLTVESLRGVLQAAGYHEVRVGVEGGWRYPASLAFTIAPGLDPQVAMGWRPPVGRLLAVALAPVALAVAATGHGAQLVAVARRPSA